MLKTIFYSLAALVRKILFSPLENNIHIFAPPSNILYVVIVIQHYFLVASFASMSVISFHTCRTFARKLPAQRSSENHERKLYKIYLTIISVLPVIFAAVCFLLDLNNVMNLACGDPTVCWFRQNHAFVYFIHIPAALSLSFNIVTSLIIASYFRKHGQNMAIRECNYKRSNLAIYIKLSGLVGLLCSSGCYTSSVRRKCVNICL